MSSVFPGDLRIWWSTSAKKCQLQFAICVDKMIMSLTYEIHESLYNEMGIYFESEALFTLDTISLFNAGEINK